MTLIRKLIQTMDISGKEMVNLTKVVEKIKKGYPFTRQAVISIYDGKEIRVSMSMILHAQIQLLFMSTPDTPDKAKYVCAI